MTKQENSRVERRIVALSNQVYAAMQAADQADGATSRVLQAAADTITAVANRESKKLNQGAVRQLPENASDKELREARLRRAVRRGESLYMPSWREMAVGLPNVLVRSAVFSANTPGKALFDETIVTQGDATLKMTGPQLGHYDTKCSQHASDITEPI